jgi:hypothetical protein
MPNRPLIKRSPWRYSHVCGATFTIGAEASNAITVNVQLTDQNGADLAARGHVGWFLSSDANGDAKAAAASGGVAVGTDGHITALVTGVSGWAFSESDGDIDIVITDTTVRTVYLNILLPDGSVVTSGAIAFA